MLLFQRPRILRFGSLEIEKNIERKTLIVKGTGRSVEVKAMNGIAKSLRTLIKSNSYPDIKYGIKFTGGNIGCSDNFWKTAIRDCAEKLK